MPTETSSTSPITSEVRRRLGVDHDTVAVIEAWLTAELDRHALRVGHAGERGPGKPRSLDGTRLDKLMASAREQAALPLAQLARLGYELDLDALDVAIGEAGARRLTPAEAAADVVRACSLETHAARRSTWAADDARRVASQAHPFVRVAQAGHRSSA